MGKNEKEISVGADKMRVVVADPEETAAKMKKADKLNAMRIAQTHIEVQGLTVEPEGACEIADKFLAWLEK